MAAIELEQRLQSAIKCECVEGKKEILIAVQYAYLREEVTQDEAEEFLRILGT